MTTRRLPASMLAAYGLPGLPLALLGIPLYVFIPQFYAASVGVGLSAIGIALLVARASDVVSDPLVGTLADRLGFHGRRRAPWMVAGVPVLCVGLWRLFVPPVGADGAYLLAWSMVTYLGWTMVMLPYLAWGAELSGDRHERSRVTAVREGFVIVGTLAALTLPVWSGGDDRVGMRMLALVLLVTLPVAVALTVTTVGERARSPTPPPPWRDGLALLARNPGFTRLLGAWLLNGVANALPATLFLLFVDDLLALPERSGLLLVVYFVAGLVALPAWVALSRRIGKHRTWAASMLWASAAFATVPFLGAGDFVPFLVVCVLTGISVGCDTALPASMQADVIEADTAAGGGGRAGLYFGLWGMTTKIALALAVGLAFPALDFAGFQAGGDNDTDALFVLAALYGGVPILLKLGAVALVWRFPE